MEHVKVLGQWNAEKSHSETKKLVAWVKGVDSAS